jgi:phenylacetate-CoA ligase
MEKITGRTDDMIILRGVNVFPTQIEEQLMAVSALAPHFQIELDRKGRMDQMTVHVELTSGASGGDQAAEQLARKIKSNVGVSANVVLADTGGVARSQGKAVRIIDNRPKE